MPVEFLSDEQAEAYGTFAEEPTRPELERFFFLDDVDCDLIALRRTEHHRLGFALQMCTVRYVGLFLEVPLAVPWAVIEHLAVQLGIEDPSVVKRYTERRQTLYDHAWEIRDAYAYHPYEDDEWGRRFRTFLHGRAWTHAEGPKALFDPAVGWLRRHRNGAAARRATAHGDAARWGFCRIAVRPERGRVGSAAVHHVELAGVGGCGRLVPRGDRFGTDLVEGARGDGEYGYFGGGAELRPARPVLGVAGAGPLRPAVRDSAHGLAVDVVEHSVGRGVVLLRPSRHCRDDDRFDRLLTI
nr:DUF4158 domain-containing protein [Streptomyces sp. A1547]